MSDRQLLLIDVCGRLPYDFVIKGEYGNYVNVNYYNAQIEHLLDRIVDGLDKLVLRPLSSMTKEEKEEYDSKRKHICDDYNRYCFDTIESIDWLNKNMFDYRGLIPKGLAVEGKKEQFKNYV